MKWCFFVVLVVFAAIVKAEQEYQYDWDKNEEYDNYYDYDTLKELDAKLNDDIGEFNDPSEDKDVKVEDEIQKVDADNKEILASKEILDSIDDYQVEDNRDKSKESVDKEEGEENHDLAKAVDLNEDPIAAAENKEDDYALLWGDDNVAPEPAENEEEVLNESAPKLEKTEDQVDIDKILEETKNILEETDDNFDDNLKENKAEDEPNKEIIEEAKNILESDGDEFESEQKNIETKSQEDIDKILEETKKILEETNDNFDDNPKENEPNKEIIEEAKQILESEDDEFEPEVKEEVKSEKLDETPEIEDIFQDNKDKLEELDPIDDNADLSNDEISIKVSDNEGNQEKNEEEDTVDKVQQDLKKDLDKLLGTLDKLAENGSDDDKSENDETKNSFLEEANELDGKNMKNSEEVLDNDKINEDEQDKLEELDPVDNNDDPSNDEISIKLSDNEENQEQNEEEDTVDKVKLDLNNDLDKLLATLNKLTENGSDGDKSENHETQDNFLEEDANKFDDNYMEESEEVLDDDKIDKILDDIIAKDGDIKSGELDALLNDELNEPNPDDTFVEDVETVPEVESKSHPIAYLNDAFIDEGKDEENIEDNKSTENKDASIENTVNVEDLNDRQLEELTKQFVETHADEIDLKSPHLDEDSAPIHETLYLDEAINITSPDYPSNYSVNNIVEWVLEGDGMGIEMNITDLQIDSAEGHYLMVKPGGIPVLPSEDETNQDSLLFAYRLNSPRRYRFFDVDRMYIRFYTMSGEPFSRGFHMSLKMIAPRPQRDLLPEPEAVTLEPNITARVTLALPILEFEAVKEDFRLIIAEMITSYLAQEELETAMDVDETTKIIHVTSCPLNWPDKERCTAVTFGVNLDVDVDLMKIWVQYNGEEPWVSSLAKLGIKNMLPPDMSMMTVWLVIAAGVIISMAMLAFVLWRYSCFDDYTRMKNYSDTDSIISEKRGLDLYPTPHQTLPPLYHDEYQMGHEATVDMSGFENKSYVRETMYDFESDEEVVVSRDRNSGITPRDYTRIA